MMCPECGKRGAKKKNQCVFIPDHELEIVVRYYRCNKCGYTYRTLESWIPDNMDPVSGEYQDTESQTMPTPC